MSHSALIEHVPTHLIAGPLGSGKTSLLKHLLQQRPAGERWAVLINEFGQVGIDAALLESEADGVQLAEIPGGCLCCVNGVPFQVGLGRLLRRARPQRLFIEASGLGHPSTLLRQLAAEPWLGVLALQPLVMVLDAPRLVAGESLSPPQKDALEWAGLLLFNKSAHLTVEQRLQLEQSYCVPTLFCDHGAVQLAELPVNAAPDTATSLLPVIESKAPIGTLWRDSAAWHCHAQQLEGRYSVGWRIPPGQVFQLAALRDWLKQEPWLRAKGVLNTDEGWLSCNLLAGEASQWEPSHWRRDSRLELISDDPIDINALENRLRTAVLTTTNHDHRESPWDS